MPQPQQYQRIAERYENAADLTDEDIPEASGFCSYHAFESIGGAWIRRNGRPVPLSHQKKINVFISLARNEAFEYPAATLAIMLDAMRNTMLYPIENGNGGHDLPETRLSAREAANLLRRVRGVIRQVSARL